MPNEKTNSCNSVELNRIEHNSSLMRVYFGITYESVGPRAASLRSVCNEYTLQLSLWQIIKFHIGELADPYKC